MKKRKKMIGIISSLTLVALLSACTQIIENEKHHTEKKEDIKEEIINEETPIKEAIVEEVENEEVQNEKTTLEGRKNEFITKLNAIQEGLDAMPEKKDSDKGITNAMKSYYGVSYENYDAVLNEIYALLQSELSEDAANQLKEEQIRWIKEKEEKAEKEKLQYNGGTFENVAWYVSLYESTKERCYEIVNTYMTEN